MTLSVERVAEIMATTTLEKAQRLVDQLTPSEKSILIEYLASQNHETIVAGKTTVSAENPVYSDAWRTFFRIGDALAASDQPEAPTMTEAVMMMRR